MDAASLAVSLITLYRVCLDGYSAIRTAKSLGKDAGTLLAELGLEEARLMTWGVSVGIQEIADTPSRPEDLNIDFWQVDAVIKTLGEISKAMADTKKLQERYNMAANQSPNSLPRTELAEFAFADSISWLKDRISREQLRRGEFEASIQQGNSILRKLRWVLVDKDAFVKLISVLRTCNNGLESMLNDVARRRFQETFQEFCLRSLQTDNLARLEVMESAADPGCKQLSLPVGHKARRLRLELEYLEKFEPLETRNDATSRTQLLIQWGQVYIENLNESRSLGLYESKQVLIEWRQPDGIESGFQSESLEVLCRLLHEDSPRPAEFRSLACVGYLLRQEPTRFAFVFDLSIISTPESPLTDTPSSLLDLLANCRAQPAQESRFMLARKLAMSVLSLHSTGWLHKGIRSSNVLILGPGDRASNTSISRLIEEPYLVGHGYARLSSDVAGSVPIDSEPINDQYRHPDVLGESRATFQKKYDMYSLGAVLVEIAYWRPLVKILGTHRSPEGNRKKMLDLVDTGDMAHWMGSIYSDAVSACLSCEWAEEDFEFEFFHNVVKKLEDCNV